MFEGGKALECLANDARISFKKKRKVRWMISSGKLTKAQQSKLQVVVAISLRGYRKIFRSLNSLGARILNCRYSSITSNFPQTFAGSQLLYIIYITRDQYCLVSSKQLSLLWLKLLVNHNNNVVHIFTLLQHNIKHISPNEQHLHWSVGWTWTWSPPINDRRAITE